MDMFTDNFAEVARELIGMEEGKRFCIDSWNNAPEKDNQCTSYTHSSISPPFSSQEYALY